MAISLANTKDYQGGIWFIILTSQTFSFVTNWLAYNSAEDTRDYKIPSNDNWDVYKSLSGAFILTYRVRMQLFSWYAMVMHINTSSHVRCETNFPC